MKKLLAVLLAMSMILMCLSVSFAEEKKKVTWATWAVSEEALKPTYMSMVETYMANHPDVEIEVVTWPYAQYKDQLIIAAAAGNAPDVCHVKAEWIPEFLEMGVLKDLTNVMPQSLKDDYYPNILASATIDGKIISTPWFNSPYALFYNKTLMEKAGITEVPQNWPQLMEYARKISALGVDENGNKIYGYALTNSKNEAGTGHNFLPHMWVHGGDLLDEAGNVVIDSPMNVEAFKEAQGLYMDEITPNGLNGQDARNLFAQGVIGFYYDLEMAANVFVNASPKGKEFTKEFDAIVVPAMDGPNGQGYAIQHHFLVFDTAKEDAVIGDLLEHLTGKVVLQILYDGGMGKMPNRVSVTELGIFSNPDNELTKTFVESLATIRSFPTSNGAFMLTDEKFQDALASISVGMDVEAVVKSLDAEIKSLYGQ